MTSILDIRWPLFLPGQIPLDHQYVLLAALSHSAPMIHRVNEIGIHAIRGLPIAPGVLELRPTSALTLRSPVDLLPALISLSGKKLDLGGATIQLGVPALFTLTPSNRLLSRISTIKGYTEPTAFLAAVRRQLDALGVGVSVRVAVGPRRVVRVKQQTIVGFEVTVENLSDNESVRIQESGVGGRRHLGCGLFVPSEPSPASPQWRKNENNHIPIS